MNIIYLGIGIIGLILILIVLSLKFKKEKEQEYNSYKDKYEHLFDSNKKFYAKIVRYDTTSGVKAGRFTPKCMIVDVLKPGEEKDPPRRKTKSTYRTKACGVFYYPENIGSIIQGNLIDDKFLICDDDFSLDRKINLICDC